LAPGKTLPEDASALKTDSNSQFSRNLIQQRSQPRTTQNYSPYDIGSTRELRTPVLSSALCKNMPMAVSYWLHFSGWLASLNIKISDPIEIIRYNRTTKKMI